MGMEKPNPAHGVPVPHARRQYLLAAGYDA
jgi:hypothetical protein